MKIDVSVIMPVLNGEKYISEAIESLLGQTLKSIELLVIDAGSVDKTVEIVKRFQLDDSRVKLFYSDKRSMGYQYNIGMNVAQGKYIGFLEADDCIYTDNVLEKMFVLSEENELDFIKANFKMFVDGKKNRIFLPIEQAKNLLEENNLYNCVISLKDMPELLFFDVNHWKGIYRKSYIDENRIVFNETKGAAFQDMGFVYQSLLYAEKCMYIKEYYYGYRRDNIEASTFSNKGLIFAYNEFIYILQKLSNATNITYMKMIYKRSLYMLFAEINKIIYIADIADDILLTINKYVNLLTEGEEKEYLCKEDIDRYLWLSYEEMCKNPSMYLEKTSINRQNEWKQYHDFLENVMQSKEYVVCGYGKRGKMLETFLQVNGIDKVICYCDNDEHKQGMITDGGYEIMSVEQAVKQYNHYNFMISLEGQWGNEIKSQLLNQGCTEERITLFSAYIDPYIATIKYL